MKKILVIAPHPDDETIGCGGTLLRHKSKRDQISCILATKIKSNKVWNKDTVAKATTLRPTDRQLLLFKNDRIRTTFDIFIIRNPLVFSSY